MFELVRQYKQEITIAAAVLVTLAFGITGVVIQVLSPGRGGRGEAKVGSFSLQAVESDQKRKTVNQRRFRSFSERWDGLLLQQLDVPRFLFGSRIMEQQRMYDRMLQRAIMTSARENPMLRFIMSVQRQMQVDLIRNLVFLRSGQGAFGAEPVSILPDLNKKQFKQLDRERKIRIRRQRWQLDAKWRLLYLYELASHSGFAATRTEVKKRVQAYLKRINRRGKSANLTYFGFVDRYSNMEPKRFEKTMKELVTILKYLGSVSLASTPDPEAFLSSFNEEKGAGRLMLTRLEHDAYRQGVLSNWRRTLKDRFLKLHTRETVKEELSGFLSDRGGSGGGRSPRSGGEEASSLANDLQKRQFEYLYVPAEAFREEIAAPTEEDIQSYYDKHREEKYKTESAPSGDSEDEPDGKGDGKQDTTEEKEDGDPSYVPLETVRDQIRKTLIQKRTLRKADGVLAKIMDDVLRRKEIRGEPVHFKELAEQDLANGHLTYRVSPFLDREDLKYWLKNDKNVQEDHLKTVMDAVFEQEETGDQGVGDYPDGPLWFEDGVFLPRLIRVERNLLVPSVQQQQPSNGAGTLRSLSLSSYESGYPVWSLELKEMLSWRTLDQAVKDRVSSVADRFVSTYRTKRSSMEEAVEFMGPPVPPDYWGKKPSSGTTSTTAKSGDGTAEGGESHEPLSPPAFLRSETFETSITTKRQLRDVALTAYRRTAEEFSLDLRTSDLFKMDNGPADIELAGGLRRSLLGGGGGIRGRRQSGSMADLYEPKRGGGEDQTQIAMLTAKLPKSGDDLTSHLDRTRSNQIISARSTFMKKNLSVFISQADLKLEETPPGSEDLEDETKANDTSDTGTSTKSEPSSGS